MGNGKDLRIGQWLDRDLSVWYNRTAAGEDTHPKKRRPHSSRPGTKGEIPIEKNVVVLDEQGKKIGVTYPKRARGLVKKGRARYADAYTICLACPPDEDLEDMKMNDNNVDIRVEGSPEEIRTEPGDAGKNFTAEYFLERIEQIAKDTDYLREAVAQIQPETAISLREIVGRREETNQKLIEFYQKAYFKALDQRGPAKTDDIVASMRRQTMVNSLIDGIMDTDDKDKVDALLSILRRLTDDR